MLSGTSKLAHAGKITFSAPVNEFLHGLGQQPPLRSAHFFRILCRSFSPGIVALEVDIY
jgi:hypothetical protein